MSGCCCRDEDPRACYGLRYYGRYPYVDPRDEDGYPLVIEDEVCECGCHHKHYDELIDELTDEEGGEA